MQDARTSHLPPADEPTGEQIRSTGQLGSRLGRLGAEPKLPPLGDPPKGRPPRILLVDDEENFIENTRLIWGQTKLRLHANLEFFHYKDERYNELVEILTDSFGSGKFFATVYMDMNLKEGGANAGIGLIERLRETIPGLQYIPFVAITAHPDPERERAARERGAIRFIIKTTEPDAAHIFGGFVHRLISEARETLEQCEDQLWGDTATHLAVLLRDGCWEDACKEILHFIHIHFNVKGLYARRLGAPNLLVEIAVKDHFDIAQRDLDISDIPFLRNFINSTEHESYQIIDKLSLKHIGARLPDRVEGHHAALARIGVGKETFGLLTMYRLPDERPFRKRDAEGLARLATLLAAAIAHQRLSETEKQEAERLRTRQRSLLEQIRQFDTARDELSVWEQLRDALFASFVPTIKDTEANLKVTVRLIEPGTNMVSRAWPPKGFMTHAKAPPICLEDKDQSSVARCIWQAKSLLFPHLDYETDLHHFMFRHNHLKSALTVPAVARGICVGAANLESLIPDAFSSNDQAFVELMVEAAAAAILRARTRQLLEKMTEVTMMLATPRELPAKTMIDHVVKILFDFSGCSEILMVAPPEGGPHGDLDEHKPWNLKSIFQRQAGKRIIELNTHDTKRWQDHVLSGWHSSFIYKVVSSGKTVDWTQESDKIILTDEGLPGRPLDKKTRAQTVIVVRKDPGAPPDAVICLLFPRRHAISETQVELLNRWGEFLASLLQHNNEVTLILGQATVREQEARLGQVNSQLRHGLLGKLALIRQHLRLVEDGISDWTYAATVIKEVLTETEQDVSRNKWMIKVAASRPCELGALWTSIRSELAAIADEYGGRIEERQLESVRLSTDRDILCAILFNLIDNALRYGGPGTVVSADTNIADDRIFISVRDTGQGIAESIRVKLFEPMTTTSTNSTGLGLYLSRLRANDLGGNLTLVSSGPKGTCFEISLPNVSSSQSA